MTPYQQTWQRKRTALSIAAALLLHLLILGGVLLYDLLFVEDLSDFSGPVLVKLGEPVGDDIPVLPDPEPPAQEPPAEESAPPAIEEPSDAPADETVASPVTEPPQEQSDNPETLIPDNAADPVETAPAETTTEEAPVRPQPEEPAEPQPQIIKGEEAGNSWEYQFETEEGMITRAFGDDISLHMPLPAVLPASLVESMTGDSFLLGKSRQDIVKSYYRAFGDEYILDAVPEGDVTSLWGYLDDAGYDREKAEYKEGRYLRPVVIRFSISENAELGEVEIIQSSGFYEVDRAVERGFRSASFSNSAGRKVNGRFTYRFE